MVYHWQEAMTSSHIPVSWGGLGHRLSLSHPPSQPRLLLTHAAAPGAKWNHSLGLVSTWSGGYTSASFPPGFLCQQSGAGRGAVLGHFEICAFNGRNRELTAGPSLEPSAPSHPVPGLWDSVGAVALLKGASSARAAQPASQVTGNGLRNQMCAVTGSCVSPSYFNTKFTMCFKIHATGPQVLFGWPSL